MNLGTIRGNPSRYHSPLRRAQAAGTRARIIDACVSVMRTGGDLTYDGVARAAGVQTRTVYRHFPTKADLEHAVWAWITEHLTHADLAARTEDELIAAMRESFAGFDAGGPLIQAMLHSRQGFQVRMGQQARRRAMFQACVAEAAPGLSPELALRAAAALQLLYSAAAWDALRSFWGMNAAEAADTVELAIRALLSGLRTGAGPLPRPAARRRSA